MDKKLKLVAIASLVALVVSFGLLAVPQFIFTIKSDIDPISGYLFFFNSAPDRFQKNHSISGVSGLGIASIVLMTLALASYLFFKKSSAFVMLGGILNVVTSVLYFMMELSKNRVFGTDRSMVTVGWVAYVIGAFLVLTGLASIYYAFRSMQVEKKEIQTKKNYSYLKK